MRGLGRTEAVAGAYALALLVLSALHLVVPQRAGPLAVSQVFAPHLFLPLFVLMPFALLRANRSMRALVLVASVVGLVRFAPGMVSLPPEPTPGATQVRVMSWNLAAGVAAGELLVQKVLASDAEIVGLQELTSEHVAAIEDSAELAERFPHRALAPRPGVLGIGLLSAHPMTTRTTDHSPPLLVATVALTDGPTITVATAHPLPAQIALLGGLLPIGYDPGARDESLALVRRVLGKAGPDPLVLLGDFNVTDREPAYVELNDGLIDAHSAVGFGPGSTWRPATLDFLPFGILRIDYVFTGNGARPLSIGTDCVTNAGDHCIVSAIVELSKDGQ